MISQKLINLIFITMIIIIFVYYQIHQTDNYKTIKKNKRKQKKKYNVQYDEKICKYNDSNEEEKIKKFHDDYFSFRDSLNFDSSLLYDPVDKINKLNSSFNNFNNFPQNIKIKDLYDSITSTPAL